MSRMIVPNTVGGFQPGTVTAGRPIVQTATTTVSSSLSMPMVQTAAPVIQRIPATTMIQTVAKAPTPVLTAQSTTGSFLSGTVTQAAPRIVSGATGIAMAPASARPALAPAGYVVSGAPTVTQLAPVQAAQIAAPVQVAQIARPNAAELDDVKCRLGDLEIDRAARVSSAFVFIKPHAVTDGVRQFVTERFSAEGITVLSEGPISSEKIDQDMLIDAHYGAIASRAMKQKPTELVVSQKAQDEFQQAFGLSWKDALAKNIVYNLVDGAAKLGVTYAELGARWGELKKGVNLLKFGGGFYCGQLGSMTGGTSDMFVINGFYADMRSQFTVPGECIYYYEVQWDASRLPWGVFRGQLLGGTDPKTADESSMRNIIFKNWEALGLAAEPNTGNNGLHASASPFEALSERSNWLGVPLSRDFFGRAMLASGIPLSTIEAWCEDPAVMFEGKQQSLFDLLEDLDGRDCLAKSRAIVNDVKQAPVAFDAVKDGLEALEIERAETVSSAFVFIKPHAVTDEVRNLVLERFAAEGIAVLSEGPISSEKIDQDMLIDTHYGAIASRAMKQKPAELAVAQKAQDEFQQAFGLSWEDALANDLVYNLVDGAAKLGISYAELGDFYDQLKKGVDLLKFGGGFYCGKVGDIFVINGFYARMRAQFTVPGECIYYFEVQWDTARLPWADFRGKLLGGTDPKTADETSLRNIIFCNWQALGLASEPNTGNNGLHASASPFEALSERSNWLGVPLSEDFFGRAMLASGIPLSSIESWCQDPAVMFDGKKQSLFDLLEDLDGRDCLQKSADIEASN